MHETRGVKIISSSKKFLRHAKEARRAAKACLLFFPTLNTKRGKNTSSSLRTHQSPNDPSESPDVRRGTTRGYLNAEVHIYLIKDEEMRNINKKFRGKDKTTNVLSFKEPKGFPRPDMRGKKCLGEVYLAPDHIEAKGERIEELVIHGILHVAGYTHDKTRDRIEMERKEDKILKHLTQCPKSSLVSTSARPR